MNLHKVIGVIAIAAIASASSAIADEPNALSQVEQLALVKQLRQEKKYGNALKLLDEMIGPATQKNPLPKQRGWAFANLEARKAKAEILEDLAVIMPKVFPFAGNRFRIFLWGNAVQEWVIVIRAIAPAAPNPNFYELYVEQKRCTLCAYVDLGTLVTKGSSPDLKAKFAQLEKDFEQVVRATKTPPNVRDRAQQIARNYKLVLDEFERWKRDLELESE